MDKNKKPNYAFVFGGFKQITDGDKKDYTLKKLKLFGGLSLEPPPKRYRLEPLSKPGKLCKKVFEEDYEQETEKIEDDLGLSK